MKPIDELVALLEESGVEFEARRDSTSHGRLWFARWGKEPDEIDGVRWKFKATEMPGDALMFYVVADAFEEARAAVEATLGRGTCKNVVTDEWGAKEANHFKCSECGARVADYECYRVCVSTDNEDVPWSYCPNCGAKVVE